MPVDVIRSQVDTLHQILKKLEKLAAKKALPEAVESLVTPLLSGFKAPSNRQHQYARRLRYGLYHYYVRHYLLPSGIAAEE